MQKTRGNIEVNLLNNFMSLKISWKPSFSSGTERATQRTSNLKQNFKTSAIKLNHAKQKKQISNNKKSIYLGRDTSSEARYALLIILNRYTNSFNQQVIFKL